MPVLLGISEYPEDTLLMEMCQHLSLSHELNITLLTWILEPWVVQLSPFVSVHTCYFIVPSVSLILKSFFSMCNFLTVSTNVFLFSRIPVNFFKISLRGMAKPGNVPTFRGRSGYVQLWHYFFKTLNM